jgi:hypothetical protein
MTSQSDISYFAKGPVLTQPPPFPAGTLTLAIPRAYPECFTYSPFPPMLYASPLNIGEIVGSGYLPQFQYLTMSESMGRILEELLLTGW